MSFIVEEVYPGTLSENVFKKKVMLFSLAKEPRDGGRKRMPSSLRCIPVTMRTMKTVRRRKKTRHKEDSDTETEIELVDLKPLASNLQEGGIEKIPNMK